MSYDVDLCDASGKVLPLSERFEEGGTYAIGGTVMCELNITYNYYQVFGTLVRDLDGKSVADTVAGLREFAHKHAGELPDDDYWKPTAGNARVAIRRLLSFANEQPHGIWRVT